MTNSIRLILRWLMQDDQLSMTNAMWKILCDKCNVSNRMALCNLKPFYGTNSNLQMQCNMTNAMGKM